LFAVFLARHRLGGGGCVFSRPFPWIRGCTKNASQAWSRLIKPSKNKKRKMHYG